MVRVTVIDFGRAVGTRLVEAGIKQNYEFLRPNAGQEGGLVEVVNNVVDADKVIQRLRRIRKYKGPFLVATDHKLFQDDKEIPEGALSYSEGKHRIAVVSSYDLYGGLNIVRKAVHVVGHWYGLEHHAANPRNTYQCPMADPNTFERNITASGISLCGLCQQRVDPKYGL